MAGPKRAPVPTSPGCAARRIFQAAPEDEHSQDKEGGQQDGAQALPRRHERPEADGETCPGEQRGRPIEGAAGPGDHGGDHEQTGVNGRQPPGEIGGANAGHEERGEVVIEWFTAVAYREVNVAHAVIEDAEGGETVVGFIVGEAGRHGGQRVEA